MQADVLLIFDDVSNSSVYIRTVARARGRAKFDLICHSSFCAGTLVTSLSPSCNGMQHILKITAMSFFQSSSGVLQRQYQVAKGNDSTYKASAYEDRC
jgi:hypothetical protein